MTGTEKVLVQDFCQHRWALRHGTSASRHTASHLIHADPADRVVDEAGRFICSGSYSCGRRRSPATSSATASRRSRDAEFVPLGHDRQGVGPFEGVHRAARSTSACRRRCCRTLSIASGSCTCTLRPCGEQPVDQHQRRRLADVVGPRLEGQAPDGDRLAARACRRSACRILSTARASAASFTSSTASQHRAARRRAARPSPPVPARPWGSNCRRSRRRGTGTRSRCGCRGRCRGGRR